MTHFSSKYANVILHKCLKQKFNFLGNWWAPCFQRPKHSSRKQIDIIHMISVYYGKNNIIYIHERFKWVHIFNESQQSSSLYGSVQASISLVQTLKQRISLIFSKIWDISGLKNYHGNIWHDQPTFSVINARNAVSRQRCYGPWV